MKMNKFGLSTGLCLVMGLLASAAAWAETQVVAADHQTEANGDVTITLSTTGDVPEVSVFATDNPARIVLDMAETGSSLDSAPVSVGSGPVQSFTTLTAGGRTRVLVDLFRPAEFDYQTDGGQVVLSITGSGSVVSASGSLQRFQIQGVDFRRSDNGESRVIISLDGEDANVAVNASSGILALSIFNTGLPDQLNQMLDVVDFATPVQMIDISPDNGNVRVEMTVNGLYEHVVFQSGNDLVVEVAPVSTVAEASEDVVEFYEEREYTGTRVTFNFQDIPVRSVLQLIADVSDLNIVVADNVGGNLTLRLTNVPWDQALDIILDARNLDMRQNGNVIWIAPTSVIAAREQELLQAMQDRRELEPLQTAMISVNYANAGELKALIEESSSKNIDDQGLLSPRGSVAIDTRTNTLLITDTPDRIEAIRNLVTQLDHPVRQVQIESRIVVASSDFSHELGVRFGVTALHDGSNILAIAGDGEGADLVNPATNPRDDGLIDLPGIPERYNVNMPVADANAGTIGLSFLSGNFLIDLELSALEADGDGEVISTPRVVTANQTEAFIQQGVEIPYEQSTSSGATSVQFKEAVLELRVTPLITPDNRVQLDLGVKQDTVGEIYETARGGSVPSIDTREIETSVLVNNGDTVVLGGIFQDQRFRSTDKVPYLSSIPGLGALFRRRSNETQKRELLIFVTPTIVEESLIVN